MKIALIYTPYYHTPDLPWGQGGTGIVNKHFGTWPSISLGYVAGIIKETGNDLKVIDMPALNIGKEESLRQLKEFNPDVIGFTITTFYFQQTIKWIKYFKNELNVPAIVGGVHVGLYPVETLECGFIDYGITGEAEESLPELLYALQNKGDLSRIDGICYKDSNTGKIIVNNLSALKKSLDEYPFPAWEYFPIEKYYSFISQYKNFTGIVTSRGCPFRCIFCEQGGKKYRTRSPENILEEIKRNYYDRGVRELDFYDSSFTVNKKRIFEFCELLSRQKFKIVWAARSRVDAVDEELLKALSRAGCKRIYYGIESSSPKILKAVKKDIDLSYINKIIHLTKKYKMDTFGYFMFGNPYETNETMLHTLKYSMSLNLDFAMYSKATPMPGTELYEMYLADGNDDYWRNVVKGIPNKKELGMVRTAVTVEQADAFERYAYIKFYIRLSYIIKRIFKIRTFFEFKRYTAAAVDMVISEFKSRIKNYRG